MRAHGESVIALTHIAGNPRPARAPPVLCATRDTRQAPGSDPHVPWAHRTSEPTSAPLQARQSGGEAPRPVRRGAASGGDTCASEKPRGRLRPRDKWFRSECTGAGGRKRHSTIESDPAASPPTRTVQEPSRATRRGSGPPALNLHCCKPRSLPSSEGTKRQRMADQGSAVEACQSVPPRDLGPAAPVRLSRTREGQRPTPPGGVTSSMTSEAKSTSTLQ